MNERGTAMMGGEIDQIKRRINKAAGVLADDDSLTSEGQLDQVEGKVKVKVATVKGKLAQAMDQMKAALTAKRASRLAKWGDWPTRSLPSWSTQGVVDGNPSPQAADKLSRSARAQRGRTTQ
jgi:uncharacterized protein YjbJ (UPF0337 family)